MIKILALFLGLMTGASMMSFFMPESGEKRLGAFGDTFLSIQLATDPTNGECLTTDGTDNLWSTCASGGGSDTNFTYDTTNNLVYSDGASTTATTSLKSFYFTASSTSIASSLPYASSTAITATNFWGTASLATALGANGSNCSAGSAPLGVDASGAVESCFDVWTEAENTAAAYLKNILEDTTPELGGDLDANNRNITELGDVTFKTGAVGGTLRTGTSAADKFNLEAYDVDGGVYVDMFRVDAGNDVTAEFPFLTSNGFLKTSGGTGSLSVDTTTYESGLTAGDGLTRTVNDFDCDTASGSVFGCLSSANWTTFNNKQDTITVTHPILLSGADLSLAFSTTTANTWSLLQTFTTGYSATAGTTTNATTTNLYATNTSLPDDLFSFSIASTSAKFATSTVSYLPSRPYDYTVTDIDCFVVGATSKAITIFGESITCDTDGATDDGSIAIANVSAGSTTVSYTMGNTVGVVNDLFINVYGRKKFK